MSEHLIRDGGVELAAESFGDAANPPLLLIMGAMASMLWWPDPFCECLAARGLHVIRYDNRDTGRSMHYPPGQPGYGFGDMVEDVFRILDGHGLSAAHVAGMSLGGMIGQAAALKRPARIRSLTVISSSPLGEDTSQLPSFSATVAEHMNAGAAVDWSDRAQVIDYMIEDARLLAGSAQAFDGQAVRAFIECDYDRAGGYLSATNHGLLDVGRAWQGRLRELRAPLLVIHGTADPIYPIAHGRALANAVDGSTLLELEGGGHEIGAAHWDTIADAIASQARR